MSRGVFYWLVFSMILATVTCLNYRRVVPRSVNNFQSECKNHHHHGECMNFNRKGLWPRCDKFACATGTSRGARKEAIIMKYKPPNGLQCGPVHICYDGVCGRLQSGESMPTQTPTNILEVYECFHRRRGIHRRH